MQDSQWDDVHIFTCIPTLSRSILLAGPPSTFIIAVRRWGTPRYSELHHDNVENNAQEMLGECPTLFQLGEKIPVKFSGDGVNSQGRAT
ncbi:hypothetical protein EMCRGX_G003326 [Ephydatia muelleri]